MKLSVVVPAFNEESLLPATLANLQQVMPALGAPRELIVCDKRIAILHRRTLRTSDRKARLYRRHEHVGFLLKTFATSGRTLRRREDWSVWYDGRR